MTEERSKTFIPSFAFVFCLLLVFIVRYNTTWYPVEEAQEKVETKNQTELVLESIEEEDLRECTAHDFRNNPHGKWVYDEKRKQHYNETCKFIKARYNCIDMPHATQYRWVSELESSKTCKIKDYTPNSLGRLWKERFPDKSPLKIFIAANSHVRTLYQAISCTYSHEIKKRFVLVDDKLIEHYDECRATLKEDLNDYYKEGTVPTFEGYEMCNDNLSITHFEGMEIYYQFGRETVSSYNFSIFGPVSKYHFLVTTISELINVCRFPNTIFVSQPYQHKNEWGQKILSENGISRNKPSFSFPETSPHALLDLWTLTNTRSDAHVVSKRFPKGDTHLCLPGIFSLLYFHFLFLFFRITEKKKLYLNLKLKGPHNDLIRIFFSLLANPYDSCKVGRRKKKLKF